MQKPRNAYLFSLVWGGYSHILNWNKVCYQVEITEKQNKTLADTSN
jgi:hypothetical protein